MAPSASVRLVYTAATVCSSFSVDFSPWASSWEREMSSSSTVCSRPSLSFTMATASLSSSSRSSRVKVITPPWAAEMGLSSRNSCTWPKGAAQVGFVMFEPSTVSPSG